MKLRKIAAAFAAAAAAITPLSADRLSVFVPSAVYAADHAMGAALPEWIPDSFESALEFRNTYGATLVRDGLVCVVFKESMAGSSDGEQQVSRYEIRTTEGMMKELKRETYSSESAETGSCYEVAVYYAPEKQGEFAVALTDKWVQICIMPENGYDPVLENNTLAQKAGIDLGGVNASAFYSFEVDKDMEITETDIYGWLPDCAAEYEAYKEKNGAVSARDDLVLFCIDKAVGTAYSWTSAADEDMFTELFRSSCSMETARLTDGGTQRFVAVYRALNSGKGIIRWELSGYADDGIPPVVKTLTADCSAADDKHNITLDDSYIDDAYFSFSSYSLYSGDLKASSTEIYDKYKGTESAVIRSKTELTDFLSEYLEEKALNKFVSQYSDTFFGNYVLVLGTYLDPYQGRVFKHGFRDAVYRDGKLVIDHTSVVSAVRMRTSCFDILKAEIPKEQYDGSDVVWKDEEILEQDCKRISVIDADTGKPIEIPYDDVLDLFSNAMKYCEGSNPYYCDNRTAISKWTELKLDADCLPEGYEPCSEDPVVITEYPYNSADIVFNVRKAGNVGKVCAIDKISAATRGLKEEGIISGLSSAVVSSVSELSEVLSRYLADELQKELTEKYNGDFFKDNVLFLNFTIDSTGGKSISIEDTVVSDGKISVYYIKPSPDYGICNTDYFCIMQQAVPRSSYHDEKVEWKCLGDVNGDKVFGIADMLILKKWLAGASDAAIPDWTTADLCRDGRIDVFDLCMLRKQLISIGGGYLTSPYNYDYTMTVDVHYGGRGYDGRELKSEDFQCGYNISKGDIFCEETDGKWTKVRSADLAEAPVILEVIDITDEGIQVKQRQNGEASFRTIGLGEELDLFTLNIVYDGRNHSYKVRFSREYALPVYGIDYDYSYVKN